MHSMLHVCLSVGADTAVETEPANKLGPRLRIGDDRDALDLSLPFNAAASLRFLTRLASAVAEITAAISEHGTAYDPAPIPR